MAYDDFNTYYDRMADQRREEQRRHEQRRDEQRRDEQRREHQRKEQRREEQRREEQRREEHLREEQRREDEEYTRRKRQEIDAALDEGRRTGDYSKFLRKINLVPAAPPVNASSAPKEPNPLITQWGRLRTAITMSSLLPPAITADWVALLDTMKLEDRPGSLALLSKIRARYATAMRFYHPRPAGRLNLNVQGPFQPRNEADYIEAEMDRLRMMLEG